MFNFERVQIRSSEIIFLVVIKYGCQSQCSFITELVTFQNTLSSTSDASSTSLIDVHDGVGCSDSRDLHRGHICSSRFWRAPISDSSGDARASCRSQGTLCARRRGRPSAG